LMVAACFFVAGTVSADEPADPLPMSPAEEAFAEQMSRATLVGNFTVGEAGGEAKPERYELGDVRKVGDGQWLIPARIVYGDKNVLLPITLPVKWGGDTAVIVVDKVGFPGLGEYSARVLIHDGRYAGYWQGDGYGGHLFGTIVKPEPAAVDAPTR
ncbi:MAG: hypothetical protein AAGF31_11985, partial [Planctomycetota bacterium]